VTFVSDARTWLPTDRPNELVAVGQPLPGVEILSARGSTRHWSETVHETFTIAAVHPGDPRTAAEWRTRGRSVVTKGGQMMTINAGDSHATLRVHAPAAFDAIRLCPSWMDDAAQALGARRPFRFQTPNCDSPRVFSALRRLVSAVAEGDSVFTIESACHDLTHVVVGELAEAQPTGLRGSRGPRDFRLRRVCERLIDEAHVWPSLGVLERDAGLGKSQLCALFKREYGVSIVQYWMHWRIAKARTLLLDGLPAKYVAVDLGFVDEAHFSRVFRKHEGLPPGAWVSLYRRNTRGAHRRPRLSKPY
jgi:AraC-like DNA-binding protein